MSKVIEQNDVSVKEKIKIQLPKQYKVIILNDDYTPFDFVVEVIMDVFNKNQREALQIMQHAHRNGKAMCGIFSKEVADLKVILIKESAESAGFPLQAVTEEDK